MTLTFLGTGTSQGVPMIGCQCNVCTSNDRRDTRLRSSVMIETEGVRLVVDSGPDFRYQMLRAGVDRIDAILYTHEHKDHTGGMDDVRAFNHIQQAPAELYCTHRVASALRHDFHYAFAEQRYPGAPQVNINIIEQAPFSIKGIKITPIELKHLELPVTGFRIGDLCYITDCNFISDEAFEQLKGVKILVINALRRKAHISHFTLTQALEVIAKIAPQRAYLTHCSHQLGLYVEVMAELPENVFLAYDKLQINY